MGNQGIRWSFPGKFLMDPDWVIWKDFWLEISDGTWLVDLEEFLVGNFNDEALGKSDGFWVGRSEKGCRLVHQTGPGSGNVWVGCTYTPALTDEICC